MGRITLMVGGNQLIFRAGLSHIFDELPEFEVIGQCQTVSECIYKVPRLKPDLFIIDDSITQYNSHEVINTLVQRVPLTKIIVISDLHDGQDLISLLSLGIRAYLVQNIEKRNLINAVENVLRGDMIISAPIAIKLQLELTNLQYGNNNSLTTDQLLSKREFEVLRLVAKGAANKEIAATLYISENTVKGHMSSVMSKLHANNRQHAIALAREKGMICEPAIPLGQTISMA
ncbi:response regulator transcription factor [Chloroflexota bacterium]